MSKASALGPAARLGFEDLLLGGGSLEDLEAFLRERAAEVADDLQRRYGEDGAEAARILGRTRGV
jgi:hypothetical protein